VSDSSGDLQRRRWIEYKTATGATPVRAEINDLPLHTQAALDLAMDRFAEGRELVRDVKSVGDLSIAGTSWPLYELRVTSSGVEIRLLFVRVGRYHHVCLGLRVFKKKQPRLPDHERDRALERFRAWLDERNTNRKVP
jgi:phage-related protein